MQTVLQQVDVVLPLKPGASLLYTQSNHPCINTTYIIEL